ncbi:MAG: sugar phosphate isomerase/epimerase [Armatimonadetes bacterium]|nr:sugar phosphate isomerase/epimerase [Armatimonadota bacterium]
MKFPEVRFAACSLGLRSLEAESAVQEIAAAGYDGVDLWQVSPYYGNQGHLSHEATQESKARLKSTAAEQEVEFCFLASYPGIQFTDSDHEVCRKDLEWARQTIDLAVEMGIPAIRVAPGRNEDPSTVEMVLPYMREVMQYADGKGVRIGMETHGGMVTIHADCVQKLIDRVGSENLGVLYDPANIAHHGEDYQAAFRVYADHIVHVHLKNMVGESAAEEKLKYHGPGDALISPGWVMTQLHEYGYSGYVSFEYEPGTPNIDLMQARQELRAWLEFFRSEEW